MRKAIALATVAALGLTGNALAADDLSYSFIELGYINTEIDDFDVDGDGLGVRGSLAFTDLLHGFAAFSDGELDGGIDVQQIEVGLGLNWPISSSVDLIGAVSYVDAKVDTPIGNFSDDGIALTGAVRGRIAEQFELRGGLKYVEFDEGGSDTAFEVGGRYYFTEMFALGLDASFDDDGTTWILGGRFDFGR